MPRPPTRKAFEKALRQSPNSMAEPNGRNLRAGSISGSREGLKNIEAALALGPNKRHLASEKQFTASSAKILKRMEKKSLRPTAFNLYNVKDSMAKGYAAAMRSAYETTGHKYFNKGRFGDEKYSEDNNKYMRTTAASLKDESKRAYKWEKAVNRGAAVTGSLDKTLRWGVRASHFVLPAFAEGGSVIRHGITSAMYAGTALMAGKTAREFKKVADQHEGTSSFARTQFFRGKQAMSDARAHFFRGKTASALLGSAMDIAGTKMSLDLKKAKLFSKDALSSERWKGMFSGRKDSDDDDSSTSENVRDYLAKKRAKDAFKKHVLHMDSRKEKVASAAAETLKHLRIESHKTEREDKAATKIEAAFKGWRQRDKDLRATIHGNPLEKRTAAEAFAKDFVAERGLRQASEGRETLYAAPAEALYVRSKHEQELGKPATKIQALVRGHQQREKDRRATIHDNPLERRTAAEAFAKDHVANREHEQASEGRETLYKRPVEARQALFEHKINQATKIQAAFRGKRQRDQDSKIREALHERPQEAHQALAEHKTTQATKIQAAFRGKRQRDQEFSKGREGLYARPKEAHQALRDLQHNQSTKTKPPR
jgi:hypothetical protein